MKTCKIPIFVVSLLLSASAFGQFDDSAMRVSTARRILQSHSVELDADKFNLGQLMDIEARLGTSRRIKSSYNLESSPMPSHL